jgi:5-methylcytosine-specific restriction endonuclease McrA
MGGAMGYDGRVPVNAGAGDRQAPNAYGRTSAAGILHPGAFFVCRSSLFYDGAVGIPSGMPVSHNAGSWRTLSYRRHLDRQASGDGFSFSYGRPAMSVDPSSVLPAVPATKRCNKCGEEKPLSDFYSNVSRAYGRSAYCKSCTCLYRSDLNNKNKEKLKSYYKKYRSLHKGQKPRILSPEQKERISAYQASYRATNRRKIQETQSKYYLENKEKVSTSRNRWKQENPEAYRAIKRNRRARKRNAEGSHTAADIQQLLVLQKSKCAVCHTSIKDDYHVDHVIPLAMGGGNGKDNLQLLCPPCNLSKNAKHPIDFMQERGMLL